MKITYQAPEKTYPYLAIWTGGEPIEKIDRSEIVMISLVDEEGKDKQPYVQYISGCKKGWVTTKESDYKPLPVGYKIEITQ